MTTTEPGAPASETSAGARRRPLLRAVLPHLLTALAAIAATLGIQAALFGLAPPAQPASIQPTAPALATPAASATPVASPTTPQATTPPLAAGIARQEVADLRAEIDRLWTTIYLLKAIGQIADAETTLRANDIEAVDQLLISVDDSLALAYQRADESLKNPIDQFRRDVDMMRGDLYLYPERMDVRLEQLRQLLLALVEARR